MSNAYPAVKDAVSMSDFNLGLDQKTFKELRNTGVKVVMKGNVVECVLLSPEQYVRLVDELETAKLYALAVERMSHYDPSQTISQEEVDAHLGITEEDLKGWEDIELE